MTITLSTFLPSFKVTEERDRKIKRITRAKSSYGTCDEVGRAESSYGTRSEEPRAKSSFGTCEKNLKLNFIAQDPSKYQISLRSGHPFVSYKYLNFQNYLPPPNSTKESRSGPVMSVTYLRQVSILPIQFHPDLTALSIF